VPPQFEHLPLLQWETTMVELMPLWTCVDIDQLQVPFPWQVEHTTSLALPLHMGHWIFCLTIA
jgi:hypothetical protein